MAELNRTVASSNAKIPNDWEITELGKIAFVNMGQSPESENYNETEEGLPLIQGNADMENRKSFKRYFTKQITKVCDAGDLILSVRAPVGSVGEASFKSCIGRGVCAIKPNGVNKDYLYQLLISNEDKWKKIEQGSTFTAVSSNDVKRFNLLVSKNEKEQKAIARILNTWDDAIQKTEQLIAQKEQRKKWLMQQLLTGAKQLRNFKKVNYKKIALNKILSPIRNPLIPEEKTLYQQIGIRSHGKGIFYKEMVSGKVLGNKRVFWIEANCLILNIVFAWEQAIAKTTESEIGMIASHRFPMFKPVEGKLDLNYILYYFKSPRGKQLLENASPGGAGRNKTLGQAEFINQIISLPTIEEQTAIAQLLQAADKEITLLKAKSEKLRKQKKGLMQQLLTGKTRLKINK